MSGKIELRYHPALKEMWFRVWENDGWVPIDSRNPLYNKYALSNKKDGVILQNLGSEFFDDIAESMQGKENMMIDFKGTELDHGDFMTMIEHRNRQNKGVSFSIGKFTKLKDMESIYRDVKSFSEDAVLAFDKAFEKNNVLKSTKPELQEVITHLKNKRGKLDDSTVNLCFVGTYSSGKSTLINAILGYEVLPEAVNSETAKMFRVCSVEKQTDARILFYIRTMEPEERLWPVELWWNEAAKTFDFRAEIQGSTIRDSIQKWLTKNKNIRIDEQLKEILKMINQKPNSTDGHTSERFEYVDGIVELYFPIPLCNDGIDFVLYDTPGTDSNHDDHLKILRKALEEQTNSILIFVNRSVKLEGTGNAMLIELLNDIEANATASTIDVGRSLFVLNAADEIKKGHDSFEDLRNGVIKLKLQNENSLTGKNETSGKEISLHDKRLFFVSARAAYVARADINNIATDDDKEDKFDLKHALVESRRAGYFQHNRMALSEYDTEQMKVEAEKAVEKANGNIDELFVINSGLFSLENEVKKYGHKFAMAVKAKSIIDAIQDVVRIFDTKVKALENDRKKDRESLEMQIKELKENLVGKIKEACKKFNGGEILHAIGELPEGLRLTESARIELNKRIEKTLDEIWGIGLTGDWIERDGKKARSKINGFLSDLYIAYDQKSKKVLESKLGCLNQSIIDEINNCNIDDETKKRLLAVPGIQVGNAPSIEGVDIKHSMKNFFFIKYLDRDKHKTDVMTETSGKLETAYHAFATDYKKRLSEKSDEIRDNYLRNIDRYSGDLEQLRDDKMSVEKDLRQLASLVRKIEEDKENLFDKIWGEQNG